MDLKQKMDGIAKGNELVRLLLFIVFFPVLAPYLLIEWIIESIKVKEEKKEFKLAKGSLGRFLFSLGFWIVNGWIIIFLLPARAEQYVNEHYLSITRFILSENHDLLNSGLLLIGKYDLAGWISQTWSYKTYFYILLIIVMLSYSRLNNYYKLLIKADLIKPNWLSNILFG